MYHTMSKQRRTIALIVIALMIVARQATSRCASGFMQPDLLKRRVERISTNEGSSNVMNSEFRLVPDMNFTCNGTITSLLLGVDVRTVTSSRNKYPEVQLWRRNQLNNLYCRQTFQEIRLSPRDFSPDGVLVYTLTPPMQFQSGDVLGVYQPQQSDSVVRLYYSTNDSAPVAIQINDDNPSLLPSLDSFSTVTGEYILLYPVTDSSCSSGFLSPPDLRQKTLDVNINRVTRREQQQRLFPDINFTCNGSITKWIVGGEMSTSGADQPELQIWRRDSGGGNNHTKINFSLLTPNETSDPNVHEYYPEPPLEFQEGDILGVYTPDDSDSQLVVYYQENTGPENYRQGNVDPPAPSIFTLGNTTSQNDYPLVAVEISTEQLMTSLIPTTIILQQVSTPAVTAASLSLASPLSGTSSPSPSSAVEGGEEEEGGGMGEGGEGTENSSIIAVISVSILIFITTVTIVLMVIFTLWKSNHKGARKVPHTDFAEQIELQQNVCYSTSLKNKIENTSEPDTCSYTPVDVEHTDPPIDVDQNVAYYKHIELQQNVCYATTSFMGAESSPGLYTYILVDVKNTDPAQTPDPAVMMVENIAYGVSASDRV